mgnify:CR=1 FL=1
MISHYFRNTSGYLIISFSLFFLLIYLSPSIDTYVNRNKPKNSYSNSSTLKIETRSNRIKETLMKFDLSGLGPETVVTGATLNFYIGGRVTNTEEVFVYAALSEWDVNTDWNNRPSTASDYEDSITVSGTNKYYSLNVTELVQDWLAGSQENYGIVLAVSDGSLKISSSESSSNQPYLSVDYEPGDSGEPGAVPGGVEIVDLNVPLSPANSRIVVVAKDGSGSYRNIQDAFDNSRPGDTIQVKNGVYSGRISIRRSGTPDLPIALVNYPDHRPIIDPGGGDYPSECCSPDPTARLKIDAEWVLIEGMEIRYGLQGIVVLRGHNTIRGNHIHHNKYDGIQLKSESFISDVLIENNVIEHNGVDMDTCVYSDEFNPKFCHAVYLSDHNHCQGIENVVVRRNVLKDHGGAALQANANGCNSDPAITNVLVENNLIKDTNSAFNLYHNVFFGSIRNNTVILRNTPPNTIDASRTFFYISGSVDEFSVTNNIFHTTRQDIKGLHMNSPRSSNTFENNVWDVRNNSWKWDGSSRTDFLVNYQHITGWDGNGQCCGVDPMFVSENDFHIRVNSPAVDSGDNQTCAPMDFEFQSRSEDAACDAGMDEYR